MRNHRSIRALLYLVPTCLLTMSLKAAESGSTRMDQVLDTAIANERAMAATLESHRPVVETYVQTVKPDPVMGSDKPKTRVSAVARL